MADAGGGTVADWSGIVEPFRIDPPVVVEASPTVLLWTEGRITEDGWAATARDPAGRMDASLEVVRVAPPPAVDEDLALFRATWTLRWSREALAAIELPVTLLRPPTAGDAMF